MTPGQKNRLANGLLTTGFQPGAEFWRTIASITTSSMNPLPPCQQAIAAKLDEIAAAWVVEEGINPELKSRQEVRLREVLLEIKANFPRQHAIESEYIWWQWRSVFAAVVESEQGHGKSQDDLRHNAAPRPAAIKSFRLRVHRGDDPIERY